MENLLVPFLGVVFGGVITLLASVWTTKQNQSYQLQISREAQQETRRTRQQDYLIGLMERLLQASTDFQAFLGKPDVYQTSEFGDHEHQKIMGAAIAACLASGNGRLRAIAQDDHVGLTPYLVAKGQNGSKEDYKTVIVPVC